VDKYNLTEIYPYEFESNGVLATSITKYVAMGIFFFQICMFGLFSLIFSGDLVIASVIVVIGEIMYMIIFRFLNTAELSESFEEILRDADFGNDALDKSRKDDKKEELSYIDTQTLKFAYLHPVEQIERKMKLK
jgi:hypothetical protein